MIATDSTETTQDLSLEQLLQTTDTSERPYTILTGHNMGNNTLLLCVPMHQFWEISEVANERTIAEKGAFADQKVAQRKLDPAHATRLASYILKGLFFSVQQKCKDSGEALPSLFEEMQRTLGKQPYLALQPLTANIRSCNPGGKGLRVTQPTPESQIKVYLSQQHVLWIVDGQHRREAMRLVFEFLKHVLTMHKYPKGSIFPGADRGQEVSAQELHVWAMLNEAARSRCKVMVEAHLGLDAEQERQLFHDLNNLTKKIESGLAFKFDNSNPVNLFIKEDLIEGAVLSADVADKDKLDWHDDQGEISRKDLIGINALLFLNKTNISGAKPKEVEEQKPTARSFWEQVSQIGNFGQPGSKLQTVAAQPVVLKALAKLVYTFAFGRNKDEAVLQKLIAGIPNVDFSHKNPMWRYYLMSPAERDAQCPGLKDFVPAEDGGGNRDIGGWDPNERVFRFGPKHNDIHPIIGDMIRWELALPNRRKTEE